MGFRLDQFIGLNPWAQVFVKGKQILAYTERTIRTYASGMEEVLPAKEVYVSDVTTEVGTNRWKGMSQEYPLLIYKFANGEMYFEFVQHEEWSGGPLVFTALKDQHGNSVTDSLWKRAEIRNYF